MSTSIPATLTHDYLSALSHARPTLKTSGAPNNTANAVLTDAFVWQLSFEGLTLLTAAGLRLSCINRGSTGSTGRLNSDRLPHSRPAGRLDCRIRLKAVLTKPT
jgi:hypothetical protein